MRHTTIGTLALCLAACLGGCVTRETVESKVSYQPADVRKGNDTNKVLIEQPKLDPHAKIEKAPELPEKMPLPSTCVEAAKCLEQAGDKADADSATRKLNYRHAQHEFSRALKTDPKCIEALVGTARVHDKLGNHAEAVKGYQQALAIAPSFPEIWFELGMSHNQRDDMVHAVECLRKAATLEPGNAQYSNHLTITLAKAGKFEESLAHLRQKLPEDRANFNVARMANHFGRRDLCGQYLHAALQANPNLLEAQQMLAVLEGSASPSPQ